MYLPIINTILLVLGMIVGVIRDQLGDPAAQWAKTAHMLILGAALIIGLLIIILLSNAGTPAGAQAICGVVVPCATASVTP